MQSNYIPNIDLADIINKDLNSDAAKQVSKNIKKEIMQLLFGLQKISQRLMPPSLLARLNIKV